MKTIIFLAIALFFMAAGAISADEKKPSPFGKKPAKTEATATTAPAEVASPSPKPAGKKADAPEKVDKSKKADSPKNVDESKRADSPKKAIDAKKTDETKQVDESKKPVSADKKAAETKPVEKTEATSGVDTSVGDTIECKSGTDVRKLVIVDKDAGCEVEYTKFGDTKVIGGAQYERDICTNVVAKLRATLETSGFTCN